MATTPLHSATATVTVTLGDIGDNVPAVSARDSDSNRDNKQLSLPLALNAWTLSPLSLGVTQWHCLCRCCRGCIRYQPQCMACVAECHCHCPLRSMLKHWRQCRRAWLYVPEPFISVAIAVAELEIRIHDGTVVPRVYESTASHKLAIYGSHNVPVREFDNLT